MVVTRDVVRLGDYLPSTEKSYAKIPQVLDMPNLIKVQLDSYDWFIKEGLRELLDEISPIQDFTGSKMELRFGDYSFGEPKYSERESRDRDATYAVPLRVSVELLVKETGEVKEQELFMGDFPLMTPTGTFVINGAERVVVSQLVRSPGVYFTKEKDPTTGRDLAFAKVIPNRGAWLEFETSNRDVISVKVDRKRKIPITTLLRAIDNDPAIDDELQLGTDERILALFADMDEGNEQQYIRTTIEREPCRNKRQAL
ncbi:MAG TPA: DNA-directed RNA polymerase subunit beta, partial [Dehalococcoidia bacterium]